MMRRQPNNKARVFLWLAIPNRYFRNKNCFYLDRGIFSIPLRHFIFSLIIPYQVLWNTLLNFLIAVLTYICYNKSEPSRNLVRQSMLCSNS